MPAAKALPLEEINKRIDSIQDISQLKAELKLLWVFVNTHEIAIHTK